MSINTSSNNRALLGSPSHATTEQQQQPATENSTTTMGFKILQILVTHSQGLLGIQDFGRLSITSKKVAAILDDALVWKGVFEKAAAAGRGRYNSESTMGHFLSAGHTRCAWIGEDGLLTCFSDPQENVLATCGYKRAAGCLLGKTCNRCHTTMVGQANPITMERLCHMCYIDDEDGTTSLIRKSKAKEAFLLSDKDCLALPMAEFADQTVARKACTGTVLLLSHVKEAAFAKHGGEEGLAAKIQERKAAADERYRNSQTTSKPQKKRSKIERLSDRPAQDLKRLSFWLPGLPIGTIVGGHDDLSKLDLQNSFQCSVSGQACQCQGNLADIVMHEKLEHGVSTSFYGHRGPYGVAVPQPTTCPKFDDLVPIDVNMPGAATEHLIHLFQSATMEYSSADAFFYSPAPIKKPIEERKMCFVTFEGGHADNGSNDDVVKVCVDFIHVPGVHTSEDDTYLDICFQIKSNQVPKLVCGFDFRSSHDSLHPLDDKFHANNCSDLTKALGIDEATVEPSQLLTMLVLLVLTRDRAIEEFSDTLQYEAECMAEDSNCTRNENLQKIREVHQILSSKGSVENECM